MADPLLPAAALLSTQVVTSNACQAFGLGEAFQLPPLFSITAQALRIQVTRSYLLLDSAAGLAQVTTVAESALLSQKLDLGKGVPDSLLVSPELQLPHSRIVDHHPFPRDQEELAMGGCMAPFAVATQVLNYLGFPAQ